MDVMANIRNINLSILSSFSDLLGSFASFSDAYCKFGRYDLIFDMYSEDPSVKDSYRKRWVDIAQRPSAIFRR